MKIPNSKLSLSLRLSLLGLTMAALPCANAATLYWDSNSTTAGAGATPTGTWGTSSFWNDDSTGANLGAFQTATLGADDLFFVAAPGAASGNNAFVVTVDAAQVANSLTFQASGATTLSGGTSITLGNGTAGAGGITINQFAFGSTAQGTVTIGTPLILANAQTWTNNSASSIKFSGNQTLNNGGFTLTFSGNTNTDMATSAGNTLTISGSGGIIKNGTGSLVLDTNPTITHTFSGGITINGGRIGFQTGTNVTGRGNVTINGGYLGGRSTSNATFAGGLGTGTTAIQILGGTSGFSGEGSASSAFQIGAAASVLKWGATGENGATGFFNPTVLLLGGDQGMNVNGKGSLNNGIDLNGTNRTLTSLHSNGDGASTTGFTISGVISNSTGTAGFEKTGVGNIILGNANTYNGATTITGGSLTVGNTASLGSGAASNTLIFNGGTLLANAAFNSVATRGVTMTATGIINTNNFAVGILGNITGAGGLTKNGTNTLTLSGTNDYVGVTTVNAGALAIAKQLSLYNNTPASWTAANLNVKSGATLQLNVDSAGAAGFDSANLNTLLTNISVANTAAQGLQSGAILAFDTSTATGGTFTQGNPITNSTGASGGLINVTKLGTGTLVFDKANTYTGTTTISAGTLQLDVGGAISGPIVNNSVLLVNKTGALTIGTDFPANIGGSGSIAVGASSTLTITTPTQFQFSALNTTGAGSVNLSGVTTPIFGGLSGATGNLATVISSGYASVTNLTLNTAANNIAGNSFTYSGVIADGAAGMSLTKTGAGTQTLTGNNTYTGATFLNGGTLAIGSGSTIGKLSGTTNLNFNGGTLQFNRSGTTDIDSINNAATITVNSSSTFGVTSADAGNANANEIIGAVTLNAGQMNFNWTNGGSSGTQMILTSLSRSGTASANFNSGFSSANSRWKLTGAGTTTAGQIIGPWYTTGGNNASFASTDYAVYASDFVAQAAITGSAETTWTTAANAYTNALAAQTLTGTRTITALRNTGATATLTLATGNNLETSGLLNGVATLLTVAPGTGGVLTTPTGGGNLFITPGAGAITVSAPINDNGGNVTLVKNGSGTLTLSSTTSNFSGGVVLNAGTISFGANTNLGTAGTGITFNGNAALSSNVDTTLVDLGARAITLNNGAIATFTSGSRGNVTMGGAVTGSGGVTVTSGSFWQKLRFDSTANTFSGAITDSRNGNDGIANALLSFNSIADGVGYGNIILNGATDSGIDYGSGAVAALNLNNRRLILANNNTVFFNNASSQAVNINTDLGFSGTGARQIRFGIGGRSGSGVSTFAGKLTDNAGGAFSPTIAGGTWVFSGANTYTGQTTISGSTGATLTLSGDNSGMSGNVVLSTATGTVGSSPLLNINSSTALGTGTLTFGGGLATDVVRINNTNAGEVTVITANPIAMNRNFTFAGTQSLNLGTGTTTLGGMTTGTNRIITVTANTLTLGGTIAEAVANLGITKAGAGTLSLSGVCNYTGTTTISAGVLEIGGAGTLGAGNYAGNISIATGTTFRVNSTANQTLGGVISGVGPLVKNNTGTLTLSGNNSYAGGTNINAGTLGFANGSLGTTGAITFTGSSTLRWETGNTQDVSSRIAAIGNGITASFDTNGNSVSLGSALSGEGSLGKTGAGTLTLPVANTYAGGTVVNGGTLVAGSLTGSATALGTGPLTLTTGTLQVQGLLNVASASFGASGNLSLRLSDVGARGFDYDALIVGGNLVLDGTITVSLNGLVTDVGQSFDLIDATTIDVTNFNVASDLILPALASNLQWNTSAFVSTGVVSIEKRALGVSATVTSFSETAASPASVVTVSVPVAPLADLTVAISADNTEVSVPATVTILAGQTSATFNVNAVNDNVTDGDQSFAIVLSATGYNNGSVNVTVTDAAVGNPYSTWQSAKFTPAELLNPAISGNNADPDGDGLGNALEYALGTDPKSSNNSAFIPQATNVAGNLTLSYRRPVGGVPGVTYGVEINTLGLIGGDTNWVPAVLTTDYTVGTPVANGDGTETVTITFVNGVSGKKFGRISATF